jgi:hypothetical protein
MSFRIYSKTHPDGVVKPERVFPPDVIKAVEYSDFYQGKCPCCGERIVVREATDRPDLSDDDAHFLLHDGDDR